MSNLRMYDNLEPEEAVRRAWLIAGRSPQTHDEAVKMVRRQMPLLARALDRLVDSPRKS